ncbi:MAG: S8 family serine peptidase [Anaerolineae bacterium]
MTPPRRLPATVAMLALAAFMLASVAFLSLPESTASAKPLLQTATTIVGLQTPDATTATVDIGGADHPLNVEAATPAGLATQHLASAGEAARVWIDWGTATPTPEPTVSVGQVALRLHYTEPLPALAPDESRLGVYFSSAASGPWTRMSCTSGACTHDTTANTFLLDLTTAGYYVVAAPEVSTITVSPNPARPLRGDSVQFAATVTDYEGQVVAGATVTWEALAAAGTIDQSDLFHTTGAVGTYTAAVTARYGALSGSATVDVQPWRVFLPAIALDWPNDPWFAQWQGNMRQVEAPAAWSVTTGRGGPIVAVIDSGIDLDHPDLAANIVPGWDFVNNDASADDDNGHGTHVAGVIGAVGNNGIGVTGMGWTTRLMPVKTLRADGTGDVSTARSAIIWAVDHGARVLNLSLGTAGPVPQLEEAISYALAHGCVVVAASGNVGPSLPRGTAMYPAAYPGVIAVGAVDGSGRVAGFSNSGSFLDVVAPGVSVFSTYPNGGYRFLDGTSMATPHVAGLAALVWARRPSLPADQVSLALINSAHDLGPAGWDESYGYGLIDAFRAVTLAGTQSVDVDEPQTLSQSVPQPTTLEPGTYNPGVLWVRLQAGLSAEAVLGGDPGLTGMAADATIADLVRVAVEPGTELETMLRLIETPGIAAVYPDYILFAM